MRRILALTIALAAASALSACSSSTTGSDTGDNPGGDGGVRDTGTSTRTGDAGVADTGPAPCVRDQACPSGQVCNVTTGVCGMGTACTRQQDCETCSALANPADCGHGHHVNSYCDDRHGNVCVRGLAPCEPCSDDKDCGLPHAMLGAGHPGKCLDYGAGMKFCGRDSTYGCPKGFLVDNASGQCKATSCPASVALCPSAAANQMCPGVDQICPDTACPGGDTICVNNDLPGNTGVCIHACTTNTDCTEAATPVCNVQNGICISGCTQGSCAGGEVCHLDGFCGAPCVDDTACTMRFSNNAYCNTRGRMQPRQFKNYRDENACSPLGCEMPVDCPAAGLVCDKTQAPPACSEGCFTKNDCLAGEICKLAGPTGPQQSYTRAECRALGAKTDDTILGVCCNPGCTDRVLQCGFNEWCCAEEMSPYMDPASCGTITPTTGGGMRNAEAGECFPVAPKPKSPFCVQCDDMNPCNSDNYDGAGANWTFGYNVDPMINGGQPFKEQEFCNQVAMGLNMCTVTCNPMAPDTGCPRLWTCAPRFPPCLQDSDCNGLTCDGEDTTVMPPRPGKCQCGENNQQTAQCPMAYAQFPAVDRPRCIANGAMGKMYCVAAFNCDPPPVHEQPPGSGMFNYPPACLP